MSHAEVQRLSRCILWCVAVCCSASQCVAVCCSVLQCVAVCCSVLQCVCYTLRCNGSVALLPPLLITVTCQRHQIELCVAVCVLCVCCSVRVEVCCIVMQCVAVYCSVLQCVAVCCSVLFFLRITVMRRRRQIEPCVAVCALQCEC